jgi:voltage-gated potassium channel
MSWERWLRLGSLLVLSLALFFLAPVDQDPPGGLALRTAVAVVVLALLALVLGRQLTRHARDQELRVDGLVAAILLVLVVFAFAFYGLAVHRPGEVEGIRTRLDALYFSASTMLTIGYGDAHAAGQWARGLALVQMVFDVVYVAAAVRLLTARAGRTVRPVSGRDDAAEPDV